jgi:DNA-binding response OmpR family regulator
MHKSILVLEESPMVHDLFESALPRDYWHWNIDHESDPKHYLSRAQTSRPDIILLSNRDQQKDYAVVKEIRSQPEFSSTPILLLTFARDKLDLPKLRSLGIQGFIRKPFESSTLLKQLERVLENQGKLHAARTKPQLENLNVIDDDLLDLLSGKAARDMSLDELEVELDPTLQLRPVMDESSLEDHRQPEDNEDDESILDDRQRIEDYEDVAFLEAEEDQSLFLDDLEAELEPVATDDMEEAELEPVATDDMEEAELERIGGWEVDPEDEVANSEVDLEMVEDWEVDLEDESADAEDDEEDQAADAEADLEMVEDWEVDLEDESADAEDDEEDQAADAEADLEMIEDWEVDLEDESADAEDDEEDQAADAEADLEMIEDWEVDLEGESATSEADTTTADLGEGGPENEESWDQDIAETEAIEIELEEISLDFDETETAVLVDSANADKINVIPVIQSRYPQPESALANVADNHEIGLMEIEVIPFDQPFSSIGEESTDDIDAFTESVPVSDPVETDALTSDDGDTDDIDAFTESVPVPDPVETDALTSDDGDSSQETSFEDDGEMIEIEHTDITDIDDDDFGEVQRHDFDEMELTEISVEGIDDEISVIQMDEDGEENLLKEVEEAEAIEEAEEIDEITVETFEDDTTEMTLAGEDEDARLAFEFDDDIEAIEDEEIEADDVSLTKPEEDFDLTEFENLDAESAQMNIQEMINFRQVMKAKYDIPNESAADDSGITTGRLSQEEIDDFDLADPSDEVFEEIQLDDNGINDDSPALFSDHDPLQDDEKETDRRLEALPEDENDEIELLSEEELDSISVEDLDVDDIIEDIDDIDLLAESSIEDEFENSSEDKLGDIVVSDETEPMVQAVDFVDDNDQREASKEDNDLMMDELGDSESDETELLLSDELTEIDPSGSVTEFETIDDLGLENEGTESIAAEPTISDAVLTVEPETDDDFDLLADDLPDTPSEDLFLDDSSADEATSIDLLSDGFADEPDNERSAETVDDNDDPFDDSVDPNETDDREAGQATDLGSSEKGEVILDDDPSFEEAEEVTIEVPPDVFEMGDFKMSSISDDLAIDETTHGLVDGSNAPAKASHHIDLPSLDDDLPDMPALAVVNEDDESSFDDPLEVAEKNETVDADSLPDFGKNIELLQSKEDFDLLPEEITTIRFDKTEPDLKSEIATKDSADAQVLTRKPLSKDSKALLLQSAELRNRLSTMIEGLIAETIQNTLQDMLPEMMERIIEEELKK